MSQKIAHLIGNGPSKAYFKNEPEGDVYGCNFGTPGIKTKANFIHDRRPLMHMLKQEAFWVDVCEDTTDTIILRTNYIRISQLLQKKKLLDKEKVIPLPKKIREKTTGHDGLLYLLYCAEEDYNEVHVWGFDSLVNGKVDSDSKGKIGGSNPQQRRVPGWRQRFQHIFNHTKKKPNKSVILHCDENTTKRVA